MSVEVTQSEVPQTCWRCSELGLPEGAIAPMEEHLLVKSHNIVCRSCLDCWDRLVEETQQ